MSGPPGRLGGCAFPWNSVLKEIEGLHLTERNLFPKNTVSPRRGSQSLSYGEQQGQNQQRKASRPRLNWSSESILGPASTTPPPITPVSFCTIFPQTPSQGPSLTRPARTVAPVGLYVLLALTFPALPLSRQPRSYQASPSASRARLRPVYRRVPDLVRPSLDSAFAPPSGSWALPLSSILSFQAFTQIAGPALSRLASDCRPRPSPSRQ